MTSQDPAETEPTEHPNQLDADVLTHALRGSLTVISARAQLLRRQIQRGRIQDVPECLSDLTGIEQAAWRLETRLRALEVMLGAREQIRDRAPRTGDSPSPGHPVVDGDPLGQSASME